MRSSTLVALLAAVTACAPAESSLTETGAALSVDYYGDTDVVGMHFEVSPCDDPGSVTSFNVDLANAIYPGMVDLMERRVDPESRHLGADLFVSLPPGCYDIMAVPASDIDEDAWEPSVDCSSASAGDIEVVGGETTAVTPLVSQCVGDPLGALDVTVLLNHPPTVALEIEQTTNYECEPVRVCALIEDVDDDPIEVEWVDESAYGWWSIEEHEPEIVGFEGGHRIWEACADIVTRWTTEYDFSVAVYDLAVLEGQSVRMSEVIDSGESIGELGFQIRTNWIEDPMCMEDGSAVPVEGAEIERAEGCSYIDAETFYCSGRYPVDDTVASFLCDENDELIEEALYPECL